jgi:hypothetical protein
MNKKLKISHVLLGAMLMTVLAGCKRDLVIDSVAKGTSLPYLVESYAEAFYVAGVGSGTVYSSIPDTIALVGDSVVGFEGGFGGASGKEFIYILKSDITGWPDTVAAGGYALNFQKFNLSNFKIAVSSSAVLAAPIAAPAQAGPTDLEGTYRRTSNGVLIDIVKVFPGVYVIANPGGAGVPPQPYLLYNYDDGTGGDKLSFECQTNPCGGGTKLVAPGAPAGLTVGEYDATYPPAIISHSPITFQWKIFEFGGTDASEVHPGSAQCQWGLAVRTFEKQ